MEFLKELLTLKESIGMTSSPRKRTPEEMAQDTKEKTTEVKRLQAEIEMLKKQLTAAEEANDDAKADSLEQQIKQRRAELANTEVYMRGRVAESEQLDEKSLIDTWGGMSEAINRIEEYIKEFGVTKACKMIQDAYDSDRISEKEARWAMKIIRNRAEGETKFKCVLESTQLDESSYEFGYDEDNIRAVMDYVQSNYAPTDYKMHIGRGDDFMNAIDFNVDISGDSRLQQLLDACDEPDEEGYDEPHPMRESFSLKDMVKKTGLGRVVTEAKNEEGDSEYTTFAGWKRACKKAHPDVWFDGDIDIANAMVGPKPYKRGETKGVGEWDGEKGSVYACKTCATEDEEGCSGKKKKKM